MIDIKIAPTIVGLKVVGVEWLSVTLTTVGQVHFDLLGKNRNDWLFPIRATALIKALYQEPIRLQHDLGDAAIDQELMRHLLVFHRDALLARASGHMADLEKWARRQSGVKVVAPFGPSPHGRQRSPTLAFQFGSAFADGELEEWSRQTDLAPQYVTAATVFAATKEYARQLIEGFATIGRSGTLRELELVGSWSPALDRSLWQGETFAHDLETESPTRGQQPEPMLEEDHGDLDYSASYFRETGWPFNAEAEAGFPSKSGWKVDVICNEAGIAAVEAIAGPGDWQALRPGQRAGRFHFTTEDEAKCAAKRLHELRLEQEQRYGLDPFAENYDSGKRIETVTEPLIRMTDGPKEVEHSDDDRTGDP